MTGNVVTIEGLRHAYGRTLALNGVDLTVAPGECVALLGPNGAGKTTLVNALTGLLRPAAGHIEIDGADPQRAETRKRITALGGQVVRTKQHGTTLTVTVPAQEVAG